MDAYQQQAYSLAYIQVWRIVYSLAYIQVWRIVYSLAYIQVCYYLNTFGSE